MMNKLRFMTTKQMNLILNFKIKTPFGEFFYFDFLKPFLGGPPTVRDLRGRPEFPLYHSPVILSIGFAKIFIKIIFHKSIDFCCRLWYNNNCQEGKNPWARIRECKSHSCSRSAQTKKILKNLLTNYQKYGIIKTLQKRK